MIDVKGLTFTYAGTSGPAIASLDFTVESGEVIGFLGPSGAGKSTTQKVLIGLLKNYEGSVRVFGKNLAEWGSDYYERIGVSFELPNHFLKLTGIENLQYFRSLYRGKTHLPEVLLDSVGLSDSGDLLVSQYSKGMKTRLGVARALLHDPELIFMDEPTAGLDPANARLIKELIKAHQNVGKTVFLTTHDMATVEELCDRAAFIVDGKIRLIDQPRALKLRYGSRRVCVEYLIDGRIQQQDFELGGLGHDENFLQILRNNDVQTLHTQEATLDEIFIQVTGRSLS